MQHTDSDQKTHQRFTSGIFPRYQLLQVDSFRILWVSFWGTIRCNLLRGCSSWGLWQFNFFGWNSQGLGQKIGEAEVDYIVLQKVVLCVKYVVDLNSSSRHEYSSAQRWW